MKIRAFTDGACSGNPGVGGWGSVILLPNQKLEIMGGEVETTNNRMELKAVIETIKLVLKLGYNKLDIYSDSAYVVNSVKNNWLNKWQHNGWKTLQGTDVKNKDLWKELAYLLNKTNKINILKIKGHSGHKQNERADNLAKEAINKEKRYLNSL